jgi:hypothetical protein
MATITPSVVQCSDLGDSLIWFCSQMFFRSASSFFEDIVPQVKAASFSTSADKSTPHVARLMPQKNHSSLRLKTCGRLDLHKSQMMGNKHSVASIDSSWRHAPGITGGTVKRYDKMGIEME